MDKKNFGKQKLLKPNYKVDWTKIQQETKNV